MKQTIAVLGAGAWGTALARNLAQADHPIRLWTWQEAHADAMRRDHANREFFPGFEWGDNVHPTSDLADALGDASAVITAVPTHVLREVLGKAKPHFRPSTPILSLSKGIEMGSLQLVSGIFEDCLPTSFHDRLAYLGGPSFAKEVGQGMPTAVVVASANESVAQGFQELLSTERFRVYTSDDVIGVELGGALKNVIAIAAGIGDGLGFGHNSRAGIITRGLAEITRLAVKMGAHPLTLSGLAGMGDLVLTCTGDLSRNRTVGLELGRGKKLADILAGMSAVAEGVRTTKAAHELARREDVDMPIVEGMFRILYEDHPAVEAVEALMARPKRPERDPA